jgi:hypothetical protein
VLAKLQCQSARHTVCAEILVVLCVSVFNGHFVVEVSSNVLVFVLSSMNVLSVVILGEIDAQRANAHFAISLATRSCLPTRRSRHCIAYRSVPGIGVWEARSVLTPEMFTQSAW